MLIIASSNRGKSSDKRIPSSFNDASNDETTAEASDDQSQYSQNNPHPEGDFNWYWKARRLEHLQEEGAVQLILYRYDYIHALPTVSYRNLLYSTFCEDILNYCVLLINQSVDK